ncbi:sugar ABC transporter ATP-binding protein [Clostridium gelidum]|uniref:Sugar ABC transporter ATP-binding protein n=1 Tax=Clostridium gelidum TaxID=704125 RepID=A0ABM7T9U9_9CLOT|nr:carbohydrate ABC transporter permease [Clostridium gelidum]BCZ48740.1 sugar ABC transporter ATP-binding protein [Clostridium gelidum]
METKVKKTNKSPKSIKKVACYLLLILLTLICLVPFYIMVIDSTHNNGEIASKLWLLPGTALLDNYHRLVESVAIWKGFANSLFIAVATTVVSGYFSALTAYGFSRYKFKGNKILYAIVLGSMMIPMQLGFIGFYQLISKMDLLNSYIPLIVPAIASASSVFFIKGYTDGAVHESLIEAARIDGSSEFYIFNKIGLPLIMPSVATMSIFTFIGTWNSYLTPLILISDMDKYTLPIMQVVARGVYKTEFGTIYTCIAISVVPIMIAFAFLSKKIIGGLTLGGVKG